jgi:hypothetical protein
MMFFKSSLKGKFHDAIITALLNMVLNIHDSDSSLPYQSQNSPKPFAFYAQIASTLIQDLMQDGQKFWEKLTEKAILLLKNVTFDSFVFPSAGPQVIHFLYFLDTQLSNHECACNPDLLKKLSDLSKMHAFYYLSHCCKIGYHKPVLDKIEQSDHKDLADLMPNQEISKPSFQYVKNKRQRDASMSSDGAADK